MKRRMNSVKSALIIISEGSVRDNFVLLDILLKMLGFPDKILKRHFRHQFLIPAANLISFSLYGCVRRDDAFRKEIVALLNESEILNAKKIACNIISQLNFFEPLM